MTTWFISDLHLSAQRPAVTQAFLHWLKRSVHADDTLYILGDFLDVWVGDDVLDEASQAPIFAPIVQGLRALTAQGVSIFLMHGNRDFLIGEGFAHACGVQLLEDPTLINVAGKRVLLTHGDALCTDDVEYQAFRRQVRQPAWQHTFLSQSLAARMAFAAKARDQSRANKSTQSAQIMDVHADAVAVLMCQYAYPDVLLHGHTHRPAEHLGQVDGHPYQRVVLGDWHATAVVGKVEQDTLSLLTLSLTPRD